MHMIYIISMIAVVFIGFGTIVWRIRSAEQAENKNGDGGSPDNGNTPDSSEGAYVYTSRKDDNEGNGRRMHYKGLQPVKLYVNRD